MTAASDDAPVVQLEGVPVRLFLESQDHQHDLVRELQLIEIGSRFDADTTQVSHRLARLISEVLSTYQPVRSATRDQATAALDRGEEVVTLAVPLHPGMSAALVRWLELLEEADALCRHGQLLLLATSPQVRDLRRWYVEQLTQRIPR